MPLVASCHDLCGLNLSQKVKETICVVSSIAKNGQRKKWGKGKMEKGEKKKEKMKKGQKEKTIKREEKEGKQWENGKEGNRKSQETGTARNGTKSVRYVWIDAHRRNGRPHQSHRC